MNFTMICPMKKEIFLRNKTNKQRFFNLLGKYLEDHCVEVVHAEAVAVVLIAQTTMATAASSDSSCWG